MTEIEYSRGDEAETLCMTCGLCCTGHLFSWVQIKAAERSRLQQLGLKIIQPSARHHGFCQPCPMWDGECAIYRSKTYPSGCRSFNCKLLRELLDESISLSKASRVIKRTKERISIVEKFLPATKSVSFRERLMEWLTRVKNSSGLSKVDAEFLSKGNELLDDFEKQFGVNDLRGLTESNQIIHGA
jgi:hypothetical protein